VPPKVPTSPKVEFKLIAVTTVGICFEKYIGP
jgi:hypothetical protein